MGGPSLCEQKGQQRPPEHDGSGPDYEHEVVNALQHAATISAAALTETYAFTLAALGSRARGFHQHLTFKVEGLWVGFDNNNNNEFFGNNVVGVSNTGAPIISGGGFGLSSNNNDDVFIARVGVNYKFGL